MEKIEQDIGAMDGKLDLIIASMKKPSLSESEGEEIVDRWTKDISEAWDEVKTRGRARNKLTKPSRKPPSPLSSLSSPELQKEGETSILNENDWPLRIINLEGLQKSYMCVLGPSRK